MSNHKTLDPRYYLNRIALETDADPLAVNPYTVIKTFFEYDDVQGVIEVFRMSCKAALTEKYSWKEGSAGNLVNFCERLETLVEACYLITIYKKKKAVKAISAAQLKELPLPCPLNRDELNNPLLVIEQFFVLYDLPGWKKLIHLFMEAGISNFSVLDNIDSKELLNYGSSFEKLIYASHVV
jgi:hypothetical protein